MTETTPGNVFARTKSIIEWHGWTQDVSTDDQGRVCLGSALQRACSEDAALARPLRIKVGSFVVILSSALRDVYRRMHHAIEAHDAHPLRGSVSRWNDVPGRTPEDVYAVLDIAAKQWEADHAG